MRIKRKRQMQIICNYLRLKELRRQKKTRAEKEIKQREKEIKQREQDVLRFPNDPIVPLKVGVCMFYDDNIKDYGELNCQINKAYCEKYKFDLIVSNHKKYYDRHPAWERLPLLIENLLHYDYLLWIDSDAFFYKDANNIVDVINKYSSNMHFIFSNDIGNSNVNTGIMIIKNSPYSIDFLTKWAYDQELFDNNHYPLWWDQGVLIDMMDNHVLDICKHSVVLPYGVLQHFFAHDRLSNTFIYHLAGATHDTRCEISKKYIAQL